MRGNHNTAIGRDGGGSRQFKFRTLDGGQHLIGSQKCLRVTKNQPTDGQAQCKKLTQLIKPGIIWNYRGCNLCQRNAISLYGIG